MRVAEATVPLSSVFDMINKEQRVVFDRDASYVEHRKTGKRFKIEWQGRNLVIEFTVLDPLDEDIQVPVLANFDVTTSLVGRMVI